MRITEVVNENDPRASSPEMQRAVMSEVRNLLMRGTFKTSFKEELPDRANEGTARFVLAIKSKADGAVKYKAQYEIS